MHELSEIKIIKALSLVHTDSRIRTKNELSGRSPTGGDEA
jgi:hypothetical protein